VIGPEPIVPRDFPIPQMVEHKDFILVPLTWKRALLDFEAYMSSVEHLQSTFDQDGDELRINGERWPANSDMEFAFVDAAWCQFEHEHLRSSFTYTALDHAQQKQLAVGYIFRSKRTGFLIECQTWVRADMLPSGFDALFYKWFRNWVEREWPYEPHSIGWPGRDISWPEWNALPLVLPKPYRISR
jgi:hypothetical protein